MLREILEREEYKFSTLKTKYGYIFNGYFQQVYYGCGNVFDELKQELDRVPTQMEYLKRCLEVAKEWMGEELYLPKTKRMFKFEWNDSLKSAIIKRQSKAYRSYILELQVREFIETNYKDIKIANHDKLNKSLDLNFGADLVLKVKDKGFIYLHITADTKWSKSLIAEKGKRESYILVDNQKFYWKRNWNKNCDCHQLLLYNLKDENMKVVNGNILFNEEYLKEYFDELFENGEYDSFDNSELLEFINWIKRIGLIN